jgi:hypothetical protein
MGWLALAPEISRISRCCGAGAEQHRAEPGHPSVNDSI